MDELWHEVHECFDTDDGSLPSIEITNLSRAGVSAVYRELRKRSRLSGEAPQIWHRGNGALMAVDSLPDAAGMVASGEGDSFHHCIRGIIAGGAELPVLGVFVWPDAIELDFRMGGDWGPGAVTGFFEVLRELCSFESSAIVAPTDSFADPERFQRAWAAFTAMKASDLS